MGVLNIFKKQEGELDIVSGADIGAPPTDSKNEGKPPEDVKDKRLLFFYGEECPHCHKLMPRLDEVESELGVKFERIEVWHNVENAEMWKKFDKGYCGGVPFLYNTATDKWLCGAVETDKVRAFVEHV